MFVWCAVCLLASPAGTGRAAGDFDRIGPRVRAILGDDVVRAIRRARRAEVFELEPRTEELLGPYPAPATPGTIAGYRSVGEGRPLEQPLLDELRRVLLDSRTYPYLDLPPHTGVAKLCGSSRPRVAVRLWVDGKGGPTHLDALLCFFCSDVALATQRATAAPVPHDMRGAELRLLRLASAALPDAKFLSEELTARQDQEAREALFVSFFPPYVQVAMAPPMNYLQFVPTPAERDRTVEAAVTALLDSAPRPEVLVTVARAFALRSLPWVATDDAGAIALAATMRLSIQDITAGLKLAAADQVALAGVAELAFRGGLQKLPADLSNEWTPRVVEAAIVVSSQAEICPLLDGLANLPDGRGRPLLARVASGELRPAERRWSSAADRASARGCALLAEAKHDGARALADAKRWTPVGPVDVATQRAVFFLAGEAAALDGALLGVDSNAVAGHVLDWFRARPTRENVDRLVRLVTAAPTENGALRVEWFLRDIGGEKLSIPWNPGLAEHVTALRSWWAEHAQTWRPAVK